jgi:hypothetical protein
MDRTQRHSINVFRSAPAEEKQHDWKQAAPRWFLLGLIVLLAGYVGHMITRLDSAEERAQQRLENAILDAPTKYQARLSERVAVVEHQNEVLSKAVTDLTIQVREQVKASLELTYQMERLTAELKKGNKSG